MNGKHAPGEDRDATQPTNGVAPLDSAALEQLQQQTNRLLAEMTVKLREQLPVDLRIQFDPTAPRVVLETEDTQRVADGYLPGVWYDRAARASGPPSLQIAAMEAPSPGLRWPGGKPDRPDECRRLYEMQIDWLAEIAWDHATHNGHVD